MPSVISGDANVSAAEFGFLDGVTSALQSQIDAKLASSAYQPGLVLITSESFSAVSSVSVNNCFSATYENYFMNLRVVATTGDGLLMRLRASGSDETGSNYHFQILEANSTTISGSRTASQSSLSIGVQRPSNITMPILINNPFSAQTTRVSNQGQIDYDGNSVSAPRISMRIGVLNNTTSYDGFTLIPNSGTISGLLRVYGYRD